MLKSAFLVAYCTFGLSQKYQKDQADFSFLEIYAFSHCRTAQTAARCRADSYAHSEKDWIYYGNKNRPLWLACCVWAILKWNNFSVKLFP